MPATLTHRRNSLAVPRWPLMHVAAPSTSHQPHPTDSAGLSTYDVSALSSVEWASQRHLSCANLGNPERSKKGSCTTAVRALTELAKPKPGRRACGLNSTCRMTVRTWGRGEPAAARRLVHFADPGRVDVEAMYVCTDSWIYFVPGDLCQYRGKWEMNWLVPAHEHVEVRTANLCSQPLDGRVSALSESVVLCE